MIVAEGLTKYYGEHRAVSDLSFEIADGEIVGLLGLNGAGKTTVLKILSCLLVPTAGHVRVGGKDVVADSLDVRQQIGFLPDTPPLYDEMRVDEYLRFVGQLKGMGGAQLEGRLDEVLAMLNLVERRRQVVGTLSHGYRQRVGIAQAIVHDPKVVILDEPISGLDPVQIVDMRETILRLRGQHTVVLSSHILHEISQTCDRLLVINEGRIVAQGSEQELAGRYGGGFGVVVEVTGERATFEALLQQRGEITRIDTVEALPGGEHGFLRARLQLDGDQRAALSKALVDAGFGLLAMSRREDELESVFLQLAGGGAEAAA